MIRILFSVLAAAAATGCRTAVPPPEKIVCGGEYGGHLQGVATDGTHIYWSFTRQIVKTDLTGKTLAVRDAPSHQGDLCVKDGTVYVAVNRGRFNHEDGAVSEVMAYDAGSLEPAGVWALPEMVHGAGGMTWRGERFFVAGGLPATHECNYIYEYTADFKFVKRHDLPTGFTLMGIQTAAYEDGRFLFGIYGGKGNPAGVIEVDGDFTGYVRYTGAGSVGMLRLNGMYYLGVAGRDPETRGNIGYLRRAPGFCGENLRYELRCNGGAVRIFYSGRDKTGWTDSGYALVGNGYRPLTQFSKVFRHLSDAAGHPVPAVCIGTGHRYSVPDLLRGVHRAAEENESLAFCFPGTPESVAADRELSAVLAAIRNEAISLGVSVVE